MTPVESLDEYRSAFWRTFAEDHGLVNEWQIPPPLVPSDPLDTKLGMTLIGLPSGVGLPN